MLTTMSLTILIAPYNFYNEVDEITCSLVTGCWDVRKFGPSVYTMLICKVRKANQGFKVNFA